jgi:hypothetical protein
LPIIKTLKFWGVYLTDLHLLHDYMVYSEIK